MVTLRGAIGCLRIRWWFASAAAACCFGGHAMGLAGDGGVTVVGIVGPKTVPLTARESSVTEPVAVIIENRSAKLETIGDAATLQGLVGLTVTQSDGAAGPWPVLIPPKSFPITIQPKGKLSVVYEVTFAAAGPKPITESFSYSAVINPQVLEPVAVSKAEASSNPAKPTNLNRDLSVKPLAGGGPTLTQTTMYPVILKGASRSTPVEFTVLWPGHGDFICSWVFDTNYSTPSFNTATAAWSSAGDHVVQVYVYPPDANVNTPPAGMPSVTIHVMQVFLKNVNGQDPGGMDIGVTTASKDRSAYISATVNPASQFSHVSLRISKGGSALQLKEIDNSGNPITGFAQGIGKGSAKLQDCTIEADVTDENNKVTPAATANVTVVIPKELFNQHVGAMATSNTGATKSGSKNVTLGTFYYFPVTVAVGDQFGRPIGTPDLYQGAPVKETFYYALTLPLRFTESTTPISSNSDYVVNYGVFYGSEYLVPANGMEVTEFQAVPSPVYPLPTIGGELGMAGEVFVDGFVLDKFIDRTLTLSDGVLTLTATP